MQEVKLVEWINTETFEVKSLPEDAVIKGIDWVKIPDDAEFALFDDLSLEFRKGSSWWSGVTGHWFIGNWTKADFPRGGYRIVWERKTSDVVKQQAPEVVETQQTPNESDVEFTNTSFQEERTKIFNSYLHGVKYQYRYNNVGQWHNLTEKGLEYLTKRNVVFREKPKKITIDGIDMDKEAAIKYIEKHY